MGTLFLCSRERVKKQGRGYDYTILGKTRKRFYYLGLVETMSLLMKRKKAAAAK
jgi:hypothetical protein